MTAIKKRAIEMIERMPDDRIYYVVSLLDSIEGLTAATDDSAEERTESQIAFEELQQYRKKGTVDRDYKEELYEAMREKYENIT